MDEFPNRASFGNFCDEHANEWTPGDPPAPVEYGPVIHPLSCLFPIWCDSKLCEGICVETELYEPLYVVAHALHKDIQQIPRVIIEEHH